MYEEGVESKFSSDISLNMTWIAEKLISEKRLAKLRQLVEENRELKKENEKLKAENQNLNLKVENLDAANGKIKDEYKKLRETLEDALVEN